MLFKATALAPLLVDLPLLGYRLRIDLVDFTIEYANQQSLCNFLGYYYFQPYDDGKLSAKKIEKNRELVYYNSTQHFFRSLYEKKLDQNGYRLGVLKDSQLKGIKYFNPVSIDSHVRYGADNMMQIVGLKDSTFSMIYYGKGNGAPIDLTGRKAAASSFLKSEIFFLNDTCIVIKDGIAPNNNVRFGGEISEKMVGSFLPNDYFVLPKE